jgi:hypothetical protein
VQRAWRLPLLVYRLSGWLLPATLAATAQAIRTFMPQMMPHSHRTLSRCALYL